MGKTKENKGGGFMNFDNMRIQERLKKSYNLVLGIATIAAVVGVIAVVLVATNYKKAMEIMGTTKENTLFVGDQIFTDVMGGNLAGIRTILVKPIHPKEEIQIVLKRIPEKLILFFYKIARKVFGEKYESSVKAEYRK